MNICIQIGYRTEILFLLNERYLNIKMNGMKNGKIIGIKKKEEIVKSFKFTRTIIIIID